MKEKKLLSFTSFEEEKIEVKGYVWNYTISPEGEEFIFTEEELRILLEDYYNEFISVDGLDEEEKGWESIVAKPDKEDSWWCCRLSLEEQGIELADNYEWVSGRQPRIRQMSI